VLGGFAPEGAADEGGLPVLPLPSPAVVGARGGGDGEVRDGGAGRRAVEPGCGCQVARDGDGLPGGAGVPAPRARVLVDVVGELVGDGGGGRADSGLDVGVCLGPVACSPELGEGVLEGVHLGVGALCRRGLWRGLRRGDAPVDPGLVLFLRVLGHRLFLPVHRRP
jgi:hypothetical protein